MALKKKTGSVPASKKKGRSVKVNMEGVESGYKLIPEGDYAFIGNSVSLEEGDNGQYLLWEPKITRGKYKGATLRMYTSLQPKALWNLKGVLEAGGMEVPDSVMDLDLDELEKLEFAGTVEHDTYEGKKRSKIVDVQSLDTLDAEGDEGDSDEGDSLDPDAVREMDEEELEAAIEAYGLDVDLSKLKTLAKKRQAVIDALEAGAGEEEETEETEEEESEEEESEETEADGEEEEESEEEEITEEAIREMDADDLEKLVSDHEIDVDLSKFKTLAKKQQAVIDALEAAQEEGGEEEEEEAEEEESEEVDIDSMGKPELAAFVKEHKLKVTLEGTTAQQRRAVKKAAIKAGIVEAE